nr:haloacid dehalogenase-like family hydrolase [uncultured bacterium]
MSHDIEALKNHKPSCEFLIAIDSDGCAFDTMEVKHKECFIPNTIKFWGLQAISKYAREAAEFVNLYSKWRGVNRFPGLVTTFELLEEYDKVQKRGFAVPKAENYRRWCATEKKMGNPALEAYCKEHPGEEDMQTALAWSKAINASVHDIVGEGLPAFPFVRETLEKARGKADMMVCSQTPTAALQHEWSSQGIAEFVFTICGQECGTKTEHIALGSEGRYDKSKILMIGDAPGDQKAARANGALFFPVMPGDEDTSWERLYKEGLDHFFAGSFAGAYEDALVKEFEKALPDTPPWKH